MALGSALFLAPDWSDPGPPVPTIAGAPAPEAGFLLIAHTSAAAVLLQRVRGGFVPIYVTGAGPDGLPPGRSRQTLEPAGKVALVFMRQGAGTTFEPGQAVSDVYEVEYGGWKKHEAVLRYDEDGWAFVNAEDEKKK